MAAACPFCGAPHVIERLGDDRTRKINVRLVAATNVNLQKAVVEGRFRSDLYYRLAIYPVVIPPLRERVSDIPPLVQGMLERFSALHGKRILGVTDEAMGALKGYAWPGNVRELENLIERGVILAPQHDWIQLEHLFVGPVAMETHPDRIGSGGALETDATIDQENLAEGILKSGLSLDQLEQLLLHHAVQKAGGNLSGAARILGITRPQLSYRLKRGGE